MDGNYSEQLAELRRLKKEQCLISLDYQRKSTEELANIVHKNSRLVQTMTSPSELSEASALMGEIDACMELLKRRKRAEEREKELLEVVQKAKKQWKKDLARRRKEAILNLPVASSPLGQLIAAILESEDGKTAEDIAQWDEELESLSESEIRSALLALTKEGIVVFKDGMYVLMNVCTEMLFPEKPLQWAVKHLVLIGKQSVLKDPYTSSILKVIAARIAETGEPVADTDEHMSAHASEVQTLVDCGILQKHKCGSEDIYMYHWPMLGEKMGRKAK